ncbi:MAG: hypothetical protein GY834_03430 [Bacteroidetes bacterium]|nr:hypothetical protein [Bacteroidota bacterium]
MNFFKAVTLGVGLAKLLKESLKDGKISKEEGVRILKYIANAAGLILDKGFK